MAVDVSRYLGESIAVQLERVILICMTKIRNFGTGPLHLTSSEVGLDFFHKLSFPISKGHRRDTSSFDSVSHQRRSKPKKLFANFKNC